MATKKPAAKALAGANDRQGFMIYLTQSEKTKLAEAATASGMPLSVYLRHAALILASRGASESL